MIHIYIDHDNIPNNLAGALVETYLGLNDNEIDQDSENTFSTTLKPEEWLLDYFVVETRWGDTRFIKIKPIDKQDDQ